MNASVEIRWINPEEAELALMNQVTGQRKLRQAYVARLADEINGGFWRVSSDAILFVRGKLANGQHRLSAVSKAGKPCPFLVLTTDDEGVFQVIDTGMRRSAADVLVQLGIEEAKVVSATAAIVASYDDGTLTPFGNVRALRSRGIAYVQEHAETLVSWAKFVGPLWQDHRIVSKTVLCAFIEIAGRTNKEKALAFVRHLLTGDVADSVIFDLRERLIKNATIKRAKMGSPHLLGLFVKAYRAWIAGERPGVLKILTGEEFPKLDQAPTPEKQEAA